MTLENVLTWLKTLSVTADNYYCGTLNTKKEKSFGVYSYERRKREVGIGHEEATLTKGISILVHWDCSSRHTEDKALELYEAIVEATNVTIGGHAVDYIDVLYNEPIDVGTDTNGIFERVIDFIIYYKKETVTV